MDDKMNPSKLLPIVLLLAFISQDTTAHTDHDKARFVAQDGVDSGKCDNRFRPCKTLLYAARQANKGDKILVAEGQYTFDSAQHSQVLNDSLLPVLGGFSRSDHFQVQNPTINKTTLVNVPAYLTESLYNKGFNSIADGKSATAAFQTAANAMQVSNQLLTSEACEDGLAAGRYPCDKVELLANVPVSLLSSVSTSANDIWGHVDLNTQREYAIVGMRSSIVVVDVTEPTAPNVVGEVTGQSTSWRDVKVYQYFDRNAARWRAYAYSSADSVTEGFTIIDLNDLPNSVSLLKRNNDDNRAHNIYISNVDYTFNTALNDARPQLHLMGQDSSGGAFRSYALQVPQTPSASYEPTISSGGYYTHDASSMLITDARAQSDCNNAIDEGCTVMLDFNESEMRLWDHSDATSVEELSSISYSNVAYTHSGWFSEDQRYAFVHDELDERNFNLNTRVLVFDITSLTTPVFAGRWTSDNPTIDHNGYVRGNRYYMSNYERGLTILDISDPTSPVQAGFFDTYPVLDTTNFNGAWGVYPFLPSGNVLISDIQRGLFVLKDNTLASSTVAAFADSVTTTQSDTTLTLPVMKMGNDALSVGYQVIRGSANADDVVMSQGELTWAQGDNAAQNISLAIAPNAANEGDELFFVRLYNPQGGGIAPGLGYMRVTIEGTAQTGVAELNIDEVTALETDANITVSVSRLGGTEGELSIEYMVESDTATVNQDVEAQSGTLTWAEGESQAQTITVALINDNDEEAEERFFLTLSAENEEQLGSFNQTTVTIKDDESNQAPIVNAGDDFAALLRTAQTLQGSASDPENALVSVLWEQTSGPAVTLADAQTLQASFTTPDNPATLTFSLTATDEFGVASSASITVDVQAPAETVDLGNDTVRSSGGGSLGAFSLIGIAAFMLRRRLRACQNNAAAH
jgi:choice-of-anchor B domain-containing protein